MARKFPIKPCPNAGTISRRPRLFVNSDGGIQSSFDTLSTPMENGFQNWANKENSSAEKRNESRPNELPVPPLRLPNKTAVDRVGVRELGRPVVSGATSHDLHTDHPATLLCRRRCAPTLAAHTRPIDDETLVHRQGTIPPRGILVAGSRATQP